VKGRVHELIVALGYIDIDAEMYTFVGDYFTILKRAKSIIHDAYMPIKYKHMNAEEKARYDENEKKRLQYENDRKRFMEEKRKKDEYMNQLKESSKYDRKEVN